MSVRVRHRSHSEGVGDGVVPLEEPRRPLLIRHHRVVGPYAGVEKRDRDSFAFDSLEVEPVCSGLRGHRRLRHAQGSGGQGIVGVETDRSARED